jgi:hypothetical protein
MKAEERKSSEGQAAESPVQRSATSQSPDAPRQIEVRNASSGQSAEDPVQVSSASHSPTEARQTDPDFKLPSGF